MKCVDTRHPNGCVRRAITPKRLLPAVNDWPGGGAFHFGFFVLPRSTIRFIRARMLPTVSMEERVRPIPWFRDR